jgi:phosphatidylglycerophosphatase A
MPSNNWLNLKTFDFLLLSFLGSGKFPWAPGTLASILSAAFLYGIFYLYPNVIILAFITILIFFISLARMNAKENEKTVALDPGWIVIDEFLGVALGMSTLAYLQQLNLTTLLWFVIFFRFFDISKIFPANYFNNRKGAFPLIADDLISGLYAVLCTSIIHNRVPFFQ